MLDWVYVVLISIGVIGAFVFVSWAFGTIIEDIFEMKQINNFSNDFKDTVKHSQPTWEDVKEIASTRGLTQSKIQYTIRKYYREIMAGREDDLSPHKELIKDYIDQYRKDEPFEGLPNEVRIHLERLRDQIDGNEHLLEPLTSQIKDLLTINKKEQKHQKYYTIGGFFVGLAGFTFAIYTSFIDPQIEPPEVSQSMSQNESANKTIQPTADAAAD
ncbi:hypothetical protein [Marinobacter sp. P4B1]|uniref:hypothetical protein n=1 Tax=Marinobacter sp. P4B1 TaxID=1119533 RepID=UPI00071E245A|nr:hypothetical protein [Marinobacter sp. P4B1]KRW82830.1 hypothetical protein AQ621_15525 [Marinobacter sp. P4B1]